MTAPVFISHASGDKKIALAICKVLEDNGIACWISGRDVGPGQNFQERIVRAIRAAKVMVLVFSSNANNSNEIKKELVLASQNKLTIIPVRVEDVLPNDALAYELTTCQWLEMLEDWEKATATLIECIARYAPPGQPPSQDTRSSVSVAPAAKPKPTEPRPTTERLASVSASAKGNPLRYYVAAFLLINGALLTVFLGIPIFARPTLAVQTIWLPLIIVAAMSVIFTASSFGTMALQRWARAAGLIVSLIGAVVAAGFGIDTTINDASRVLPSDPLISAYCWLSAAVFAWSFAFYIWGWRSATWPAWAGRWLAHPAVLWAFGILSIAVTLYTFLKISTYIPMSGYAAYFNFRVWLVSLFVVDVLLFGYCVRRFHAEFGGSTARADAEMASTADWENPLRYYVAVVLLINGVLLLVGFGTAINANWTRLQAIGSLVSLSATLCAAFLVVGAIAIGTIASQLWARYAGPVLSVLAIGLVAIVGLLTYPRLFETSARLVPLTMLFVYYGIVAILLLHVAAFYLWGWRKTPWPSWAGSRLRSSLALLIFGLLLVALTLTTYLSIAAVQRFSYLASHYTWLITLVVLDGALLGYCVQRFRREYRGAAKHAQSPVSP